MAPLAQDFDISLTGHDDVFDLKKIPTSPLNERTITSSRRVSFGAGVTVYKVKSRLDYRPEEFRASWYSSAEEYRMREDARSGARLLDCGLIVETEDFSIRGLESRTRKGMRRKSRNREYAYDAVFSEIGFQQQTHYHDDEVVANVYFTYSEPCAVKALASGIRDEFEAMKIYYDNQKITSVTTFFSLDTNE